MAEAGAAGAAASALGAVIAAGEAIAAASPTHRQCNLEITNACKDFSLSNPRYQSQFPVPGTNPRYRLLLVP